MKKLFLINGAYLDVVLTEFEHERHIEVYNEIGLYYSIIKGKSPMDQFLLLAHNITELPIWEVMYAIEIYKHFEQYWNNLNQ